MEKSQKLQMLQRLSEKSLTKKFLIPLYESEGMGCKNIQYTHKYLEFGKDIIYYKDDEYGRRIYTAVQVKRTKITTKDIDTIFRQISEAFGEQFNDSSDNKKKSIDKFVLLTSNEIIEEAKQSLSASLRGSNLDRNVTYFGGDQLVILLERHLPSAFWDEYDYCNRYFIAMKTDFETIKDFSAIGQKEPVPLENIYVSLRFIEPESHKDWKITSEKEGELSKKKRKRLAEERNSKAKLIYLEKAIKDIDKLVILGVPGSGKTTLLKHLALKSCKENLENQEKICVPILIKLHEFSKSGKNLREYIEKVFENYQFPKAKEFIDRDLEEGNCELLLDGFDELAVREKQGRIAKQILKFVEKYPKNKIIVTSRIAGYHDELKGFTKLELMEFDDQQINRFIENWFGEKNPEKAKSILNAIKENERIKALARNPLMISIIAIIYEEDRKLPQKRAALYSRCTEVLLNKWDVQKKLKNTYSTEKKEFILKKLAFYAQSNNQKILSEKEVLREMLKNFPRAQLKKEDAKPFLNEIWQRSYLIRQISRDSYDFLHLSFQEYFTALELKEQNDGIATIVKYLHEPWWEEPILLYAGISKDATTLIKRIRQDVPEDIFYSNLLLFGKCIADADFTEPSLREEIIEDLWSLYQTSEFSSLRDKAIEVLAIIKPEPDYIIDSLVENLKDQKKEIQISAGDTLGWLGSEKAIEPLINALTTSKDMDVQRSIAFALGRIGSERAIEPLIKVLTTAKDEGVQRGITYALGRIGSEKAIEPLIRALTTTGITEIQISIAEALGWIGSEKAVEPLIKALATNKNAAIRRGAAYTLGRIRSENTIEPLIDALITDKDTSVRSMAASALGKVGNEKAIEPLIKALTDKEAKIRESAASALGRIRSEKAIDPLIEVLTIDKDTSVRAMAASALGWIGDEKAIKPLIKALNIAKEKTFRWSVINSLGEIGSEKAVDPLIEALATDKEFEVRAVAADALMEIGSEKAIEPLIKALTTDKESDVLGSAAFALGYLGGERATGALIEALTTSKEAEVRAIAAISLQEIGNERTIEPLKSALKDEGEGKILGKVKDRSFESLEEICKRLKVKIPL